jgi:hypothetical protein
MSMYDYYGDDPMTEADLSYEERLSWWNRIWAKQWPNHCRMCGGWGTITTPGNLAGHPDSWYPAESDMCCALSPNACHRCEGDMVDGKCKECDWQFDDGMK